MKNVVKFFALCVLAALVLVTVSYVTSTILVYNSGQCRWSSSLDKVTTRCRFAIRHSRDKYGYTVMAGFSSGENNDSMMYTHQWQEREKIVASMVVRSVVNNNETMTVAERSKFQREQVDIFCQKYGLTIQLRLPLYPNPVHHHLLINNEAETLFCFAPKVGCTHLKVLYFIAQGLIPEEMANTSSFKRVKDSIIKDVVATNSLTRIWRENGDTLIKDYYKFIMYRHPLERLVSAYRSKVQRLPLKGVYDEEPHYNWLRKRIYKHTHPDEYRRWFQDNGMYKINISFPDFIRYWLENDHYRTRHDEHLMPIFDLCAPCSVRYNYYGNFKTFEQDANVLIEKIGTMPKYLRQGYYNRKQMETSSLARDLYKQLSTEQKVLVLERLSQDVDFYYHLFPSEKNTHISILNISKELTTP